MIVARSFPSDASALLGQLRHELAESRTICVLAGHFVLYHDGRSGHAAPCLANPGSTAHVDGWVEEFGHFPHLSWQLACTLAKTIPDKKWLFLVLVNDWQYLKSAGERADFYERWKSLPEEYLEAAQGAGFGQIRLVTPRGMADLDADEPYFSERALRNGYNRRMRKMVRDGKLPPGAVVSGTGAGLSCKVSDELGGYREVYCAGADADCSKEVAELLLEVSRRTSCDTFVSLYPGACKDFVELGTELSARLFGVDFRKVINVGLPSAGITTEQEMCNESELTVHHLREAVDERSRLLSSAG